MKRDKASNFIVFYPENVSSRVDEHPKKIKKIILRSKEQIFDETLLKKVLLSQDFQKQRDRLLQ